MELTCGPSGPFLQRGVVLAPQVLHILEATTLLDLFRGGVVATTLPGEHPWYSINSFVHPYVVVVVVVVVVIVGDDDDELFSSSHLPFPCPSCIEKSTLLNIQTKLNLGKSHAHFLLYLTILVCIYISNK